MVHFDVTIGLNAGTEGTPLRKIAQDILKMTVPNITGMVLGYVNELTNAAFVGRTGDDAELAAVGLGNMMQNCFGLSIGLGICSAMDTFVSQAHGAGQYGMCASYLQRCRVIVTLQLAWMGPLLWYSEALLLAIGQDATVSMHAGAYNRITLFGLFFAFQAEAIRKYLLNQDLTVVPAVIAALCSILHVGWCAIFVLHLGLGNQGAGFANVVTWTLECSLCTAYLWHCAPQLKQSRKSVLSVQREAFLVSGLKHYIAMAFPSVVAILVHQQPGSKT
ncbi:unnamed protein product [Polarella glacialis]|uniref:Uncharacterized protein n=1 Tax=Polarella glacialis TaxID=89957 RepID=A0A813K2Z6_POLGL|nr:unnamed protein product [Polarella glacialis]